mgnify:CR=1 FL=1
MDLAKRAYDHGFRLDPIVRSLLDTDFYKLLMLQMIWREHRDVPVTFQVINRTRSVRLADEVDIAALRELVPSGVEGAIVGKALYAGAFTLAEALDVAGD